MARDPRFARHALAEIEILLIREIADRCGDEISAFAAEDIETRGLERARNLIALRLQCARILHGIIQLRAQAVRNAQLQRWRGREGVELMRLGDDLHQLRRSAYPADFPPGQRKHLPRRANPHAAFPHSGKRNQRNMAAAVEHKMLIHLIANGIGIVAFEKFRQQLEFGTVENAAQSD